MLGHFYNTEQEGVAVLFKKYPVTICENSSVHNVIWNHFSSNFLPTDLLVITIFLHGLWTSEIINNLLPWQLIDLCKTKISGWQTAVACRWNYPIDFILAKSFTNFQCISTWDCTVISESWLGTLEAKAVTHNNIPSWADHQWTVNIVTVHTNVKTEH